MEMNKFFLTLLVFSALSFNLFAQMLDGIKKDVVRVLLTVTLRSADDIPVEEFEEKDQLLESNNSSFITFI